MALKRAVGLSAGAHNRASFVTTIRHCERRAGYTTGYLDPSGVRHPMLQHNKDVSVGEALMWWSISCRTPIGPWWPSLAGRSGRHENLNITLEIMAWTIILKHITACTIIASDTKMIVVVIIGRRSNLRWTNNKNETYHIKINQKQQPNFGPPGDYSLKFNFVN